MMETGRDHEEGLKAQPCPSAGTWGTGAQGKDSKRAGPLASLSVSELSHCCPTGPASLFLTPQPWPCSKPQEMVGLPPSTASFMGKILGAS